MAVSRILLTLGKVSVTLTLPSTKGGIMAKNRSKSWKAVRVHVLTLHRLELVRQQLERGADCGRRDIGPDHRNDRIGLDAVIDALLVEWERHNDRRRASRKRKTPPAVLGNDQSPPQDAGQS